MKKQGSFLITLVCGHRRYSFHRATTGRYYCSECKDLVEAQLEEKKNETNISQDQG